MRRPRQNGRNDAFRYERKFRVAALAVEQIETLIRVHPAHFRMAFPPRFVNNIYFDSPGLTSFAGHVNGMADRSKLRLRWYGDWEQSVVAGALELKARRGVVGSKVAHRLGEIEIADRASPARLSALLGKNETCAALGERLAASVPALCNRYRRQYFVSAADRFRVTVDTQLTFAAPKGRRLSHCDRHAERRLVILELKYGPDAEPDADRVSGRFPFRLDKISKYVYGIHLMSGEWDRL